MVTFRPVKYKHRKQALELYAKLDGVDVGNLGTRAAAEIEAEITDLMMAMVASWDYTDIETGEDIPVGEPDELSDEQYAEVVEAFNAALDVSVKKTKESSVSSGPKTSRKAKSRV